MIQLICKTCGSSYLRRRCLATKSKFCSIACKASEERGKTGKNKGKVILKMRGENHPRWKGGTIVDDGRARVLVGVGKRIRRYRLVAAEALGRELKVREIVHHIDENPLNDAPSNLFVFRHRAAHGRWHAFLKRNGLEGTILKSNLV